MSQLSRASTVDFGSDNTDEDPDQADAAAEENPPQFTPPLFGAFDEGAWTSAVEIVDESVSQYSTTQQSLSEAEEACLSQEERAPSQASLPKPVIRRPWEDSPYNNPGAGQPYQASFITPLDNPVASIGSHAGGAAPEPWPFSTPTFEYTSAMIYPNTRPEVASVGSSGHPDCYPSEFLGYPGLTPSLYGGPEANLLGATRTTVRATKRTETGPSQGTSQIASEAFHAEQSGRRTPELFQEGYQEGLPAQNAAYQLSYPCGQWQGLHGPDVDQVRSSLSQEYEEPLELRTSEAYRSPGTSQNYQMSFDSLTSSAASALPPFHFADKSELGLLYSSSSPHSHYVISPSNPMSTPPQLPSGRGTRQRTRRETTASEDLGSYSERHETQQIEQASSEIVFKFPKTEKATRTKSPKSFVFSHLQIGNLHIDASNEYDPDVKRLYRLKIVFSARKLMYEFESKHLSGVAASLKDAEPRARIDVPFQYIQSLKQEGDTVTIHTFDTLQLNTYLGHREENSITHLTKYTKEPIETSSRLASYHKLTFEPGEGAKFKSFYDEALKGPKKSRSSKSTTSTSRSSRSKPSEATESAERSTSSKRASRKRPASEEGKAEEDPEEEEEKPAIKRQRSARK